MDAQARSAVFHLGDARARIPGPPGAHFVDVLQRGTARILLSMPVAPNRQTPHVQDEAYVIVLDAWKAVAGDPSVFDRLQSELDRRGELTLTIPMAYLEARAV